MGEICPTCNLTMLSITAHIWWCEECGTLRTSDMTKRPSIAETINKAIIRKVEQRELYEEHEVVCEPGQPPDLSKRHGDNCCCEEGG